LIIGAISDLLRQQTKKGRNPLAKTWQEIEGDAVLPIFDASAVLNADQMFQVRAPSGAIPDAAIVAHSVDWRKRMSDTIAYALLVYTALQIFVTMSALKTEGGSLLPYLALIILVAAIIPSCRRFERRWNRLDDSQAADPTLASRFHRDQLLVWALAVGLPFAITGAFRLLGAFFPGLAH
jgi:hypothetical protein